MTRWYYSGFGLSIESDVEICELNSSEHPPDVSIRVGEVPRSGCEPTLREEIFFLPGAAGFHIQDGREITIDIYPGAETVHIRRMLLGYGMSVLLRQRGWLVLHASAVVVEHRGVLFLGESGAGKSTTAAAFHTGGGVFAADDLAAIRAEGGECVLCPGLSRVRLLPDAHRVLPECNIGTDDYDGKMSFDLSGRAVDQRTRVNRIYLLEEGHTLASLSIPPMDRVAMLRKSARLRPHRLKRDILSEHLNVLIAVAKVTPMSRLVRPRSMTVLKDLVTLVHQELATGV